MLRKWINESILPNASIDTRWNSFLPRKVNIMIWHTSLDKIPTRMNLENWDIDVPSILCHICALEVE